MCTCDMFPAPHSDGFVDESTHPPTICELALPGPRISPHLFPWSVVEPSPSSGA